MENTKQFELDTHHFLGSKGCHIDEQQQKEILDAYESGAMIRMTYDQLFEDADWSGTDLDYVDFKLITEWLSEDDVEYLIKNAWTKLVVKHLGYKPEDVFSESRTYAILFGSTANEYKWRDLEVYNKLWPNKNSNGPYFLEVMMKDGSTITAQCTGYSDLILNPWIDIEGMTEIAMDDIKSWRFTEVPSDRAFEILHAPFRKAA